MSYENPKFRSGVFAALAAYFCWGLFPIFWKLLPGIGSIELMAHRIVWCGVVVWIYLAVKRQPAFWRGIPSRTLLILAATSALIGINWWVYIWAVSNGRIVEGSLGYFINPLVNVVFGVVFLRERLNIAQWCAVLIALVGVIYLTILSGAPPWIALALALSFGCYGLIRKVAPIDAARGLAIETAWLFLPALVYLFVLHSQGEHHFGIGRISSVGVPIDVLFLTSGPITALPLLLFAFGAQRIPLSLIGILQYLGPTLQFLTGVYLYHEPFSLPQLCGFALIWLALLVYASDGALRFWQSRRLVAT